MIRAVLFDLDETLIDRTETMRRFLMDQCQRLPGGHIQDSTEFVRRCLIHQANGYTDKHEAYILACADCVPDVSNLADHLYEDFKAHYGKEPVLFPKVLETLTILHKKYLIGLVSNGRTRGQMAKIEASGMAGLFSSVCISEAVESRKPEHRIFINCLDSLGIPPSHAVFVGDNPAADIEPARSLGMRTIWRRNEFFKEPPCDGVFSVMDELPELLGSFDHSDCQF